MGFLQPWALLALPLVALPFLFARRVRTTGQPLRFSSLYLLEQARRSPARRMAPARWVALLQGLALLCLVLAAARPVAPGSGDPASHRPSRTVVAVDVSASAARLEGGRPAWEAIRAAADSLLAQGGPGDRLALAAVADRVVGWWEGPAPALRRRLAALEPTYRASDWPAALEALAGRLDNSTDSYLLTDGSRGARPPEPRPTAPPGYAVLRVVPGPAGPEPERGVERGEGNRALTGTPWLAEGAVGLAGRAWGPAPGTAVAGRRVGDALREPRAIALGEGAGPAGVWAVADTATFAFADPDRFPLDDRRWVAGGGGAGPYRVARWTPPDEAAEPGSLFWEAAIGTAPRGATTERAATLAGLAALAPDLALLPIRAYSAGEAALLASLAGGGTRLLFAPSCADPACVPPAGWLPGTAVPDVAWALAPETRQATLSPRPEPGGAPTAAAGGMAEAGGAVPEHLLAAVPVRGALRAAGGGAPELVWRLSTGAPAFWARGAMAVWLVPLGPPATRLGATPVFPLVADAALGAWDPRWGGGGGTRVGEAVVLPPGATLTGPLHDPRPGGWTGAGGAPPPRPEAPGLYRVDAYRDGDVRTSFMAVNMDPAEGDLRPVSPAEWRAAWGVEPTPSDAWRAALFPRRRGPELWPWALVVALAALAAASLAARASARPAVGTQAVSPPRP